MRHKRGYCAVCGDETGKRASKAWEPFCTQKCAARWAIAYLGAMGYDFDEEVEEYVIA